MADTKISALPQNTAPDPADLLVTVDDPSGTPATKKMTISDFLKVTNSLTADTSPDPAADYIITYDASASGPKKVLLAHATGIQAFAVEIFSAASTLTTGDGKKYIPIPEKLAGYNVIRVHATLFAKSTSGTPTVQIARGRKANATSAHTFNDMLTTLITVDVNEFDSRDATTAPVISTSYDDLASGDLLRVDVDVAGTAATGMWITFECQKP